jgi:hypothetical protein
MESCQLIKRFQDDDDDDDDDDNNNNNNVIERSQPKGVKQKIRGCKLRSA